MDPGRTPSGLGPLICRIRSQISQSADGRPISASTPKQREDATLPPDPSRSCVSSRLLLPNILARPRFIRAPRADFVALPYVGKNAKLGGGEGGIRTPGAVRLT